LKLGISTFTYINYPLEKVIKRIANMGYDGIEIMAMRPHALPSDLNKDSRKKLRRLINSFNLEPVAICQSTHLNLISPLKKERQEAVKYIKECVALASDLGAKIVVTVAGLRIFPQFGITYEKAWKWAKEGLSECVPFAEKADIILALEPLSCFWGVNFMYSINETIKLIKEIKSKCLGITFDIEHRTHERESLHLYAKKIGNLLAHVHVRDTIKTHEMIIPGKGIINFKSFFKTLKRMDFKGYLIVEFWNLSNPDKYAIESKIFLKKILRSIS